MKIIDALHLAYDYVRTDENDQVVETNRALTDLNIEIEAGSFVCVLGHNGSGKSTFAKLLNGLNLPTEGTIYVGGKDTKDESKIWDIRKETGMVFQNPDNQIIASVVEEDVGFGPENIGVPTEEIWERVNKALDAVDMTMYRMKSPNRLSGGQKQRVAIAGTMAMIPRCIVLDEPTAMLDPSGRKEVIRTVRELNEKAGVTIILITHYMEETIHANRIIVMDRGSVVMDGTPKQVFSEVEKLKEIRMDVPEVTELSFRLIQEGLSLPDGILSRGELVSELKKLLPVTADADGAAILRPAHFTITDPIIRVNHISHIYQKGTAMESYALRDISFEIQRGSFVAFIGHTGSGKSTLTQHLDGLLKADEGTIEVNFREAMPEAAPEKGKKHAVPAAAQRAEKSAAESAVQSAAQSAVQPVQGGFVNIYSSSFNMKALRFKVGLVFQYPEYQLFEVDVISDVMFGPRNQGLSEEEARKRAEGALRMVGLDEKHWKQSPFELSGGQKRRVAIAGVLAMRPEVLILDEPTAGLDPAGREDLFRQIGTLHEDKGMTIILVSHSMDDVAKYAEQVLVLDHGELRMQGTPEEIFAHYQELEDMGLGAPQMSYLIRDLRAAGFTLTTRPDTVKEACEAICRLYRGDKAAASGREVQ